MSEPRSAGNSHHNDVVGTARPNRWLTPVALVSLLENKSYGYELMERLKEFGFVGMNPGTMYRTLRQMENKGLCKSEWETADRGPARRMYSITEAGEEYLDAWAKGCEQYRQVMDAFSEAYKGRMPRSSEKNG
jgi:PadR family transcriptional regulator, regulatory protein PadR